MDKPEYAQFVGPALRSKALNSLVGIVQGVCLDRKINELEIKGLEDWVLAYQHVAHLPPISEFIPWVKRVISEKNLSDEERQDILFVYKSFSSESDYYRAATRDMQELHGVLVGIAIDGKIEIAELRGLRVWLESHSQMKGYFPYDEIDALISHVLRDGAIDEDEHRLLLDYCNQFRGRSPGVVIDNIDPRELLNLGVCASCPEIEFSGRTFCFTGESTRLSRKEIHAQIEELGGVCVENVSKKLDYLVVGGEGNHCWAFSCYGRKVEKARQLRVEGHPIAIIHEADFWDAVQDA